jgi:type I restriction enzyme S subunit
MGHWPTKALGELCDVRIGRTPRRDQPRFWGGNAVWVTIGELSGEEITSSKENISDVAVRECMPEPVPAGTLLFSFKLTIGKMAVAGRPLYTNEAIAALPIRDPTKLSRDFLKYALSAESHEGTANNAVLGKVLNKEKVQQLSIPMPPLAEQKRIVKLLDGADELREIRAEADRRTAELIPALFHDIFGDPTRIGNRWATVPLGEMGRVITGNTPSRKNPEYFGDFVEWVKTDNIDAMHGIVTKAAEGLAEKGVAVGRIVPPGTILVTCIAGSRARIGDAAVAHRQVGINQQINAIIPYPDTDANFLCQMVGALKGVIQHQAGGVMTGIINKSTLESIPAIRPPLPLQKEFGMRVKEIRALEAEQAASRRRLNDLFQSMLHRAFSGEL